MLGDLSTSDVGGFNVRQVLRRLGEPLQVVRVDHRGHAAVPEGQEDILMSGADTVDDLIKPATRDGDRQVEHGASMGKNLQFSRLVVNKRLIYLSFFPSLAAVTSDLREHSRNNDNPLRSRRIIGEVQLLPFANRASNSPILGSPRCKHSQLAYPPLERALGGCINDRRTTLLLTDPTMTTIAYILEVQVSVEKARC